MRKIIGFILFCICLSGFYYRYSQLVYMTMGENIAIQQLNSIHAVMEKNYKLIGHYEYNLEKLGLNFEKGQFFGFSQQCDILRLSTQSHLISSGQFGLKNYNQTFSTDGEVTGLINRYSQCEKKNYTAVVVHKVFNRLGVYTIDQGGKIEIIQSSQVSFLQWLFKLAP